MNETRQHSNDPLGLSTLPPLEPPDNGWPAVEAALLAQNRRSRVRRLAGGGLAAAAAVVLAFALVIGKPLDSPVSTMPGVSEVPGTGEIESAPLRDPPLESLIAMSQQLEGRVRLYRDRAGDLPSEALVYQVELQDLIVQVDEQLNFEPDSTELWSQRVNLLLDVTQLYENSLRRDYLRMASL